MSVRGQGQTVAGGPFPAALQERWLALPDNVRGAFWILLSCVFFTTMGAIVKVLGTRLDSFQLAFFRAGFALLILLPFVVRAGAGAFRTGRPGLHVARALAGTTGMMCGFYGLTHLKLADVTAIGFAQPLFLVVLAVLVLREVVGPRRWSATAIGFVGVLIMLRPGDGVLEFAALVALLGALAAAVVKLLVKQLTATEAPLTIMLWLGAISTLVTAVPAALVWQDPGMLDLAGMAVAAGCAIGGQFCMIRGFRIGEASALAPFEYAKLPIAAAYGVLLFAEIPDAYSLVGALLIAGSTFYIGRREAKLGRTVPAGRAPAPD